jgi:hypothetical protein
MIKSYREKLLEAVESDIETSQKRLKKEEENLEYLKEQRNEILRELSDEERPDDPNGATIFFTQGID